MYINDSLLESSKKAPSNKSRISTYVKNANLQQYKNRTYDTYLEELINSEKVIEFIEDIENEDISISKKSLSIFGIGYMPEEYPILMQHYKMLKEQISDDDFVQETLIKDLCDIKIQEYRLKSNKNYDYKEYKVLKELYQSTLSTANLKPKNKKEDSINIEDQFGNWINDIEKYTPAEYFKDKKIYEDYDKLKEYSERFIFRPLKNLFTGSKDKDKEFNIDNLESNKLNE